MLYFSNYIMVIKFSYYFGVNLPQDIPDDCFTSMEGKFKDLKP